MGVGLHIMASASASAACHERDRWRLGGTGNNTGGGGRSAVREGNWKDGEVGS